VVLLLLTGLNVIFGQVLEDVAFWLRIDAIGFPSWEANQNHFMAHPLSLVFTLAQIGLPIALILALFKNRKAHLVAMVILGYLPFYIAYGTFCHPHGFSPSPLGWLVLFLFVALGEMALWRSFRTSKSGATADAEGRAR